jgi:hypothetical protein
MKSSGHYRRKSWSPHNFFIYKQFNDSNLWG